MEKRVILSALIILLASALAFNFGEDNPTGLAHGNSINVPLGMQNVYGLELTKENRMAGEVAYAYSNAARSGGLGTLQDKRARDYVEKYVSFADLDNDGLIDLKELKALQRAYRNQVSSGATSFSDLVTPTSCSSLQEGKTFCIKTDNYRAAVVAVCRDGNLEVYSPTAEYGENYKCSLAGGVAHYIRADSP